MNILKWGSNGRIIRKTLCLIALFCMGFLNCSPALAHKVSIFGWVEGNTVHTQSKFMGGKRPEQALVEVFDTSGNLLLKGKTDSQGLFSFQTPIKSDMQIVLSTGMGHRADWMITSSDFQETVTEPKHNHNIKTITQRDSHTSNPSLAAMNENQISLSDILGGIGCILGLVGLVTYIQYCRKRNDVER